MQNEHDINLSARYADYLFVLRKGKLIAEGSPQEVISEELIRYPDSEKRNRSPRYCHSIPFKISTISSLRIFLEKRKLTSTETSSTKAALRR